MSSDKISLISNVAPPTELPSFVVQQQSNEDTSSKFVPAIPFTPTTQQIPNNDDSIPAPDQKQDIPSMQDIAQALSPLTEGGSVLLGWVQQGMKTAKATAKDSIDKVVTTLDPQMSQLICKCNNVVCTFSIP